MMKSKLVLLLLGMLVNVLVVNATDFSFTIDGPEHVDYYVDSETDDEFDIVLQNNGRYYDMECIYETSDGYNSDELGLEMLVEKKDTQRFPLMVKVVSGNTEGTADVEVSVSCCSPSWESCTWQKTTKTDYLSFSFLYPGDDICTEDYEMCKEYLSYQADDACACDSTEQCNPTSERGADSMGCVTFCGNNVVESKYETCSSCQEDVGKCDGLTCSSANECENDYCVNNYCRSAAYYAGDALCDSNKGETCTNSPSDCACATNEHCSNAGVCETYCGNGICEASEEGVCAPDCDWCGDGTCQTTEKSSCTEDCGAPEEITYDEELERNQVSVQTTSTEVETQEATAVDAFLQYEPELIEEDQNYNYIIPIVLIILVTGGIVYYYLNKRDKVNAKKEVKRCPGCKKVISEEDSVHCHHCGKKL